MKKKNETKTKHKAFIIKCLALLSGMGFVGVLATFFAFLTNKYFGIGTLIFIIITLIWNAIRILKLCKVLHVYNL